MAWVSAQARNETVVWALWDVSCDLLGIPVDWLMMAAGPKRSLVRLLSMPCQNDSPSGWPKPWAQSTPSNLCLFDAWQKPSVHCWIHPTPLHLSRLFCFYYHSHIRDNIGYRPSGDLQAHLFLLKPLTQGKPWAVAEVDWWHFWISFYPLCPQCSSSEPNNLQGEAWFSLS